MNSSKLLVIALGGNALLQNGQRGTFEEQHQNILVAADKIADIVKEGYSVVLTHGNGPQIGNLLLKNEIAKQHTPPFPIDACGAATQGSLGYLIQRTLGNILHSRGLKKKVISLITQVIVDNKDPAFENPTKPIGPYFTKDQIDSIKVQHPNWIMTEDAQKGYRRVLPSPEPLSIVELDAIRTMVNAGFIVIACGGGGIPVIRKNGSLAGVEAVIDKDLVSQRLATMVSASRLIILTDVDAAYINYGKSDQKMLDHISVREAKEFYQKSHFRKGSMGPKLLGSIRFVENGGKEAIIGNLNNLTECINGRSGTHVLPK